RPWPPLYFFKIERKSTTALSFFQRGLIGSLKKAIESAPSTCRLLLDSEAIVIVFEALATAFTKTRGRQPSCRAEENDWIANFGVAKTISVSTFFDLSRATCDLTSLSVTS